MNFANGSLWEELASQTRPIFLYGTGNGGDKIFTALDKYHVTLSGVFASDGFVRNRTFHGYPVRSYADVTAEYGDDFVVLLAFGTTLPSVRAFIESLNRRHTLRIPEVPLYGGALFDMPYFRAHQQILTETAELLADDVSKALFRDAVNFRLTGKMEYLRDTGDETASLAALFRWQDIGFMVDGGAFRGDSASVYIEGVHPEKILAVEADPKTFVRLSAYAQAETRAEVLPVHAALSDQDGKTVYRSSGSRGSGKNGQNHRANEQLIPCRTIDTLTAGQNVDLIKLDVEGAEESALRGGAETIARCRPNLAVSLYHRTDDLYALIQTVRRLLPTHKLFLRRVPCIPLWDLNLYAVRE
ncbi:MAG: FkbM family methyltransferase [Eubacteriales bacterium]